SPFNDTPAPPSRSSLRAFRGGSAPGSSSRLPVAGWPGRSGSARFTEAPNEAPAFGPPDMDDAWPASPGATSGSQWNGDAQAEWVPPGPAATAKGKAAASKKPGVGRKLGTGKIAGIALLIVALLGASAGGVLVWPKLSKQFAHRTTAVTTLPWVGKTGATAIDSANDGFTTAKLAADPAFTAYYKTHGNGLTLGPALTPAFTTGVGLVQFFGDGALVSPGTTKGTTGKASGDLAVQLVTTSSPNIFRLPLVAAMMALGAKISIGPDSSNFTFADLRTAAQPATLKPGTAVAPTPPATSTTPVFIPVTTTNGKTMGHSIAPVIWAYLLRNDAYPTGWQNDLGLPVSEPLAITGQIGKTTHHFTIQGFWNGVVIADAESPDATGAPKVWLENVGLDYLRTLGPPTPTVPVAAASWVTTDAELLDTAGTGKAVAHLGARFPVKLAGTAAWAAGALWYNVSWATPALSGAGWMNAAAITVKQPDASLPPWAGLDTLSADLESLVAAQGGNLGVAIYDVTHNIQYADNRDVRFTLAGSARITIMLSYIESVESQGHQLSGSDMSALTAMIEQADGNATQALYKAAGADVGQTAFAQAHGIPYQACKTGWQCSQSTPGGILQALSLVQQGKILNATDRATVLDLMSHVQSGQQWGVGSSAPPGSKFYLTNGWAPNSANTGWDINTSGIVVTGSQTWVVSVYAQHQPNFDGNPTLMNQVCSLVAKALTAK
ncbi:MAG TPA: hypothetical protein VF807_06300, partial [Ktedonobacterales bacterium]